MKKEKHEEKAKHPKHERGMRHMKGGSKSKGLIESPSNGAHMASKRG